MERCGDFRADRDAAAGVVPAKNNGELYKLIK